MKAVNARYLAASVAPDQSPRYVVELAHDSAATDLVYFTSHPGTPYPGVGALIENVIEDNSGIGGTSQEINPLKGVASIGSLSVSLVDKDSVITDHLHAKHVAGNDLKGRRVRVYRGYEGDVWSDFELFQTQIIDYVSENEGVYSIQCSDVQRSQRKKIFDLNETYLTASIGADDTLIPVGNYSAFELLQHGTSYTDAPGDTVLYIRIEDEVIRCSGGTVDATLGPCFVVDTLNPNGRGALGTLAVAHAIDETSSEDRRAKVEEFVYLEMPLVKLALAILTGGLYGQGVETLPSNWHLGIDAAYVQTSAFTNIKADWWDPADDTQGRIGFFAGLDKIDGKKFLEQEVYQLLGAFSPVNADGSLGLKRNNRVLHDAAPVVVLTDQDIVSRSKLKHDMQSVVKKFKINWNYSFLKEETTRENILVADLAQPDDDTAIEELTFKGLHGSRHTLATLHEHFNTLRDRYAGPPELLTVTLLSRHHRLEVGDIAGIQTDKIRDFVGGGAIDRSFEVQRVSINWSTGLVSLSLFGSSQAASDLPITSNNVLSDGFYTSAGTDIETLAGVTNVSGVIHVTADLDLTGLVGHTDMINSAAVVYANGDLVIDAGVTLTTNLNTQLRYKGFLTVNGTINSVGKGYAGAVATIPTGYDTYLEEVAEGTPGIGTAIGAGHVMAEARYIASIPATIPQAYYAHTGHATVGDEVPFYALANDAGTSLTGLPTNLIGTSGGAGGIAGYHSSQGTFSQTNGGNGGASSGGLLLIGRGLSIAITGKIITSGVDGEQAALHTSVPGFDDDLYPGSGAGGCPGGVLILLDGNQTYPTGLAYIEANQGRSPTQGVPMDSPRERQTIFGPVYSHYVGYSNSVNRVDSVVRVQYIPPSETPVADVPEIASPPLAINPVEYVNTPQTPAENLATVEIGVTPPADNTYAYSNIYYKLPTQDAWTPIGPADTLEAVVTLPMDGLTYDVLAKPVSIYDKEAETGIQTTITMSDQAGGVNMGNGNYIAAGKANYADDATAGFWMGLEALVAKFNIGGGTNSMKWDGADLVITGIINALSGGNIARWRITGDTIESPNGRIILDSTNQRIRVENSTATNYLQMDGNGLVAFDQTLGQTVNIPTNGSAPIFSSGIIKEYIFEMYTSGILRTDIDPATNGGVLINAAGISVYDNTGTRTAFLDAINSNHEFTGAISVYDWSEQVQPNLLLNPTAALGDDYWYGTTATVPVAGNVGPYWVITHTGTPGTRVKESELIPFPANAPLTLSADMYTGGLEEGAFICDVRYFDSSKVLLTPEGPQITESTVHGWQRFSASGVSHASCAFVEVRFFLVSAISTNTAIKRIKLEFGNKATPFTDSNLGADYTQGAVSKGVALTSGYLNGNNGAVLLDFLNSAISLKNSTFGSQGIQLEYNGGNPRAYIGDGGYKYLKLDVANSIFEIGRDITTIGINNFFDDDRWFYHWLPTGAISQLSVSGVGAGSATMGGGGLYLSVGNTTADSVNVFDPNGSQGKFYFATDQGLAFYGYFTQGTSMLGTGYLYTGSRDAINKGFGFKIDNGTVYAFTSDNGVEVTSALGAVEVVLGNVRNFKMKTEVKSGTIHFSYQVFDTGSSYTTTLPTPSNWPLRADVKIPWRADLVGRSVTNGHMSMALEEVKFALL